MLDFKNPGAGYRGKPFWAWNGMLDKEELRRQILVMKEMGFGGFFMHSRTGLQTEYLGDEWFTLTNDCADFAYEHGMEAWLYDEDRWPSGIAGGLITRNPAYRMRRLWLSILKPGETPPEDALCAFWARLENGIDLYEYGPVTSPRPASANALLSFSVREMPCKSVYNGYTYVDTMNPEATRAYLETTHERYKELCGDRLGTSIQGIFTDEPHRGALMSTFGGGSDNSIPWTGRFPEEFRSRMGYDLMDRLPEVFLKKDGHAVSRVTLHYVEICQQLFLENFMKPIYDWCGENNLRLTGHVLHEDSLTAQTAMNGSMMRNYEYMHDPGVDVLSGYNKCYWVVKQLSSVGRQLGKKWLLSELYGCSGWQMTLEDYKRAGDWQALFGINMRCPHLSWYTMEGEGKRDYPASILHQSGWYCEFHALEDYYARIAKIMELGAPECSVLVINPIESVWCQVYMGWAAGLEAKAPEIIALEEQYQSLFHDLCTAHVDFDYGDEHILSLSAVVENGLLRVGQAAYDTVVVSGLTTIRVTTLALLERFASAGGKVIFAGAPPSFVDAEPAPPPDFGLSIPRSELTAHLPSQSVIVSDERVYQQSRRWEDGRRFTMLLNMTDQPIGVSVAFPGGPVWELCARTGQCYAFEATTLALDLAPGQEKLYVCNGPAPVEAFAPCPGKPSGEPRPLSQPIAFRLNEPNVLPLDMVSVDTGDGWQDEQEALLADRAIRAKMGIAPRGGEMLQPWYARRHGSGETATPMPCRVRYQFMMEAVPEGLVMLAMEHPERVAISINGRPIELAEDGFWLDACFRKLVLPNGTLTAGENTIELSGMYAHDSGLEMLYLLGNFGVRFDGDAEASQRLVSPGATTPYGGVFVAHGRPIVTQPPKTLSLGSLAGQGLPFYSGTVSYDFNLPGTAGELRLPGFGGACVKVAVDGVDTGLLLAKPYTQRLPAGHRLTLSLLLTRRNTFGPFHQLPVVAWAYGPQNFLQYDTPGYGLLHNGLHDVPFLTEE